MAKHMRQQGSRRRIISAAIVVVVAVTGLTLIVFQLGRGSGDEPAAVGGLSTTGGVPAAGQLAGGADLAAGCTELRVASSSSFQPVLTAMASELAGGDDCVRLAVTSADGRDGVAALASSLAHVWIPDDTSWVAGADPAVVGPPPEVPTVIATSPIHVVAGADAAAQLGPDGVSWAELAVMAGAPDAPAFVARQPANSGEGLVGVGAVGEVVWAGAGMDAASGTLSLAFSRTRAVDAIVTGDIGTDEVALVAEQSLVAAGQPAGGLVVMAPQDLTAMLRYTWVPTLVDAGDPVVDAARARLLSEIWSPRGAAALASAGLRTADMEQPSVAWLPVTAAPPMPPLGRHHVEHVFAAWYEEDRTADHLVVVDVSESMWAAPAGSDRNLLESVKEGVVGAADQLPDGARYGVWEFGASLDPPRDYRVVTAAAELSADHRLALAADVAQLQPQETGTGLYDTILAAYLSAQATQRPGIRSQVLIFTDGKNEADPGSLSVEQLGAELAAVANPQRPVNLAVVLYGAEAATVKAPLAEQLKPVRGYVSSASTVTDVINIFAHVAAGGLHG